jgi:hypothetical protein
MADPVTLDAYNRRFHANTAYHGFGLDTEMEMPCPFCAAAHWMRVRIIEMKPAMKQGAACKECGRSARFIFEIDVPGEVQFSLVQTGGAEIPSYLPPIERAS